MSKPLSALLIAGLILSACNGWREARVNPSNWGAGNSVPVEASTSSDPNALVPEEGGLGLFDRPEEVDGSVPILTVTELRVDPTSSGAIIAVTGLAARQGAYNAELRPISSAEDIQNGVLAYMFRVTYPEDPTPQGSELTRTVREAISVSRKDLQGVRVIRVEGRENARESRRR